MLLQMTLIASLMIIMGIMIRALFLHRLPKSTFLLIWSLIVFRLLVPFNIPMSFNTWSVNINTFQEVAVITTPALELPSITIGEYTNPVENAPFEEDFSSDINWLRLIWIFGTLVSGLYLVSNHLKFRKRVGDAILIEALTTNKVLVLESNKINSPLTYGLIKPVILIPKMMDWCEGDQLEIMLAHEYAHIQNKDYLKKIILTLALCVHWFNPLVWAMVILANRDIELVCDESALKYLGGKKRKSYVLTLLEMEANRNQGMGLAFSKNATEERVRSMFNLKKKKCIWGGILALSIIGITMLLFSLSPVYSVMAQTGSLEERGFVVIQDKNFDEWMEINVENRLKLGFTEEDIQWLRNTRYLELSQHVHDGGIIVELGTSLLPLSSQYELLEIDEFEIWKNKQLANSTLTEFSLTLYEDVFADVLTRIKNGMTIVFDGSRYLELNPDTKEITEVANFTTLTSNPLELTLPQLERWIEMGIADAILNDIPLESTNYYFFYWWLPKFLEANPDHENLKLDLTLPVTLEDGILLSIDGIDDVVFDF